MAGEVVLSLVAALGLSASVNAELGIRAEGRATTVVPADLRPPARAAATAAPSATIVADALALRLTSTYAPRIVSNDLAAAPLPVVDHSLTLRLETNHSRPWRAHAAASAFRGMTDPLADPSGTAATTPGQFAVARAVAYEWLHARSAVVIPVDARTTLAGAGSWRLMRASDAADGALLPTTREALVTGSLSRLVSQLDTLQLSARYMEVQTATLLVEEAATLAGAAGSWRHAFSPRLEAWAGAGAMLVRERPGTGAFGVIPTVDGGFARAGEGLRLTVQGVARLAPSVDALTGEVVAIAETSWQVTWRASRRLSLQGSAAGGAWLTGRVAFAGSIGRAVWTLRERLTLEGGLVGRTQLDLRPEYPSFTEAAVVAAVAWRTGPL